MIRRLPRTLHAVALAGTAVAGLACGDAREGPDGADRPLRRRDPASGPVTPARYGTDLTFVAFAPDGPRLHYRFRHVTSSDGLERDYGGWRLGETGTWTRFLGVRDTLPVPRARWRVLPAPGLRVVAGPDGGLRTLAGSGDTTGPARLELGRTLARWESPTGQGERFRRSELVSDGRRVRGLAVERHTALATEASAPRGLDGFLLVADSTGRGMVILRHGGTPPGQTPPAVDTTAVAHGWTADGQRSWREVTLEREDGSDGDDARRRSPPQGGWRVSIPAAGIRGRLTPGRVETSAGSTARRAAGDDGGLPPDLRDVRLYGLSGTLTVRGEARSVHGLGVEAGQP